MVYEWKSELKMAKWWKN